MQFSNIILDAANKAIDKTYNTQKKKTIPWWNEERKDAIKKYKKRSQQI